MWRGQWPNLPRATARISAATRHVLRLKCRGVEFQRCGLMTAPRSRPIMSSPIVIQPRLRQHFSGQILPMPSNRPSQPSDLSQHFAGQLTQQRKALTSHATMCFSPPIMLPSLSTFWERGVRLLIQPFMSVRKTAINRAAALHPARPSAFKLSSTPPQTVTIGPFRLRRLHYVRQRCSTDWQNVA